VLVERKRKDMPYKYRTQMTELPEHEDLESEQATVVVSEENGFEIVPEDKSVIYYSLDEQGM